MTAITVRLTTMRKSNNSKNKFTKVICLILTVTSLVMLARKKIKN